MEITLSEYLMEVFKRDLHFIRSWRLQAFAIKETHREDPYYPYPTASGVGFKNDDGEEVIIKELPKAAALSPLLPHYTEYEADGAHWKCLKESVDTRVGIALINAIVVEPFDGQYKFINKAMNPKDILNLFLDDIEAENGDDAYNAKFIDVMSDVESLLAQDSEFILRSIVEGMFDVDKNRIKIRDDLIKKHQGNLKDPLVRAEIEDAVSKASQEHYKKIGATIWENSAKSHRVTLMKTEGAYGSETNIDGTPTEYVPTSLREGIRKEDLASHVGASRMGSFGRGAMTALGGAAVNDAYQALESRGCDDDDCGTKRGTPRRIREHNYTLFIGQALAGSKVFLTESMLKKYIGKTIEIRTPSVCSRPKDRCCKLCGGREISLQPESIPTKSSGFMSTIMDVAMQQTHGKTNEVLTIDFFDDIY